MPKQFAIHSGEILHTEFMEPLGLTAYRLGIYFGLPAQFWLNLQNDYDLRLAAKATGLQKVKPRAKAA